jgi:hypothetical protein
MWTRRPLSRRAASTRFDSTITSASSRLNPCRGRLRVRPAHSVVGSATLALLGVLLVSLAACGRSEAASSPSSDSRTLPNCQAPCVDQGNGGVVTATGPSAPGGVTTNSGDNPQAGGSSVTTRQNAATGTTRGRLPSCNEPCGTQSDGSPLTVGVPPTQGPTSTTQLPPCQAPCGTQPNGNPITSTTISEPPPQDETTTTDASGGSSEPRRS